MLDEAARTNNQAAPLMVMLHSMVYWKQVYVVCSVPAEVRKEVTVSCCRLKTAVCRLFI